ncbi:MULTISPECIES: hypothetical protein [Amycolatopsis]|uniref:hypothetical protein n=1 Tax=Amycolatopsis TaxID=1813 RepID=UPI00174E2856|nr:hypothetical protein [Amycolatopsis bullii]
MNDDVADRTQLDDALRLSLRDEGSAAALVPAAAGDVDLLTAGQAADAVTAALARRPPVLVIDLTGMDRPLPVFTSCADALAAARAR